MSIVDIVTVMAWGLLGLFILTMAAFLIFLVWNLFLLMRD